MNDEKKYWRIEEHYDNGGAYEDNFTMDKTYYAYGTEAQIIKRLTQTVGYDENNLIEHKYYGTCTRSQFTGVNGETITKYGTFSGYKNGHRFINNNCLCGTFYLEGNTEDGGYDGESYDYAIYPVEYDKIIEIL